MGELFDFAQSMRKITDEQAKRAQTALALLRTAGLPKTIEEAAILCGALTREQYDALAHEVFTAWHVTPTAPRICKLDPEKDGAVIMAFRQQGRRKDVEMATMRQQMLRAGGIEVPLWEILEAGEAPPPVPAAPPEKKADPQPKAIEAEVIEEAIELSPAPQQSKFARKVEPPSWLQGQPEAKAPEVPRIPLWPAEKPPVAPPPKPKVAISKPVTPVPRPPAAVPTPPEPVPAAEPILLETAVGPAQKPVPPAVRPPARHADDTEILGERLKKLNIKIGIVGAALVLVLFLIFLTVATG
jgi:hypothetical protein